ncbi:D-2-hydroxyacid dehydrogenase [Vallitalea pronyensis]|uniref:D-2-hydroxyacid dehydrogenase n=1 Tax=Vallitalea pronyensis TaxID=1348613 RepID=A0A8J8SHQ7_9FIRM|nr:D-2-hydroxyacid dehydrogenase [Vallitalea pronyensis]QUI23653.1 D-2-hydroxyacid dehydrogenase [Vallitalea pronyensis]
MAKILVADGMDKKAAEALRDMGHELVEEHLDVPELKEKLGTFDAIIVRSATKIREEVIDAVEGSQLKLMIRAGVGLDNIDVAYARERGIAVENTPNASSASVAELAIGHMFSLARFLYISNVTMREGKWNKKAYKGSELAGKTLGLIGFGRIAKETAKRAHALGMKVMYTNRSGAKEGYADYAYVDMDTLLAHSDFISLHIPFAKEVGAVIDTEAFKKMKDGVFIVNCARGGVVDEDALVEALDTSKVAGAAIDVFAEEPTKNERLYTHEKVSVTPHIGGSTKEAQARIGLEIIEIIKRYY